MPYFPPSIWYGKKWIPVTWLPWESARIFSDATASRMHSPAMRNPAFTSKSAMSQIRGEPHDFLKLLPLHASKNILHHNLHYPSSWLKMVQDYLCHYVNLVTTDRNSGKCATLLHGQMYLQEKTPVLQFGHTLEQNSSICPSISYLWMVDLVMRFFPCGASLWRSSARIRPKKGPAPWILFLTPAPRPLQVTFLILVGEAEHVCLYPFARTTVFSAKKHVFCNLGARWHKIFEFGPSCPISGWLAWWRDFFPVGQPVKSSASIQSKKVQPLGFDFWPLRLCLLKSLFWLVKVNICGCTPFAKSFKKSYPLN